MSFQDDMRGSWLELRSLNEVEQSRRAAEDQTITKSLIYTVSALFVLFAVVLFSIFSLAGIHLSSFVATTTGEIPMVVQDAKILQNIISIFIPTKHNLHYKASPRYLY